MKRQIKGLSVTGIAITGCLMGTAMTAWGDPAEEWDEFEPIIEINASDGDIGFHVLIDGEGWNVARLFDGDGDPMLRARATPDEDLDEQGITEFFLESAEPPCSGDDEDVVDLEEFLDRFEEGTYTARGRTLEGTRLFSEGDFTHNIPAAPHAEVEVEWVDDGDEMELEVDISYEPGDDLGECEIPEGLLETHPADVEVVRWEIVVEPDEDQLDEINEEREAMGEDEIADGVYSVQMPGDSDEVEISDDWLEAYVDVGVTTFKYEVGAKEESGNQTFFEDEFDIEDVDD